MNNFILESLFVRFSTKEQMLFVKRLAFLIHAQVPIVESLQVLQAQTKSKAKAKMLDRIVQDVSAGQFLSTSLQKQGRAFSVFVINLVRVGEHSGTLGNSLFYVAEELKKKQALKTKVVGALLYPACIASGTVVVVVLLIVYIFPKILPIFMGLKITLPLSTRILVATSHFLSQFGIWLVVGAIGMLACFFFAQQKSEKFRWYVTTSVLYVPLIQTLLQSYNISNFCRILSTLLKSGMQLSEALIVTAGVTKNCIYKNMCLDLSRRVLEGESVSQGLLRHARIFPDIGRNLIAIGERTGTLPSSLSYVCDMYEQEVDEQTKQFASAVEPVVMILMGLLVGFVAVAIITPMYEITSRLTPH